MPMEVVPKLLLSGATEKGTGFTRTGGRCHRRKGELSYPAALREGSVSRTTDSSNQRFSKHCSCACPRRLKDIGSFLFCDRYKHLHNTRIELCTTVLEQA